MVHWKKINSKVHIYIKNEKVLVKSVRMLTCCRSVPSIICLGCMGNVCCIKIKLSSMG